MRDDVVILIAEDDKGHFVLTKHCLRRGGLSNEIIWFEDGQEALDFLFGGNGRTRDRRKEYVLLLDIRMPKVDGINVLRRIKSDPELNRMPVIMVTTSDASANVELCGQLGCSGYVVKPIDETLADKIEQACRPA